MHKLNCWEFKQCGRERGGSRAAELGACPVPEYKKLDGTHGGAGAGRSCWMVDGTFCDGKVQSSFSRKMKQCMDCNFYTMVRDEERASFKMSAVLLKMLQEATEK